MTTIIVMTHGGSRTTGIIGFVRRTIGQRHVRWRVRCGLTNQIQATYPEQVEETDGWGFVQKVQCRSTYGKYKQSTSPHIRYMLYVKGGDDHCISRTVLCMCQERGWD